MCVYIYIYIYVYTHISKVIRIIRIMRLVAELRTILSSIVGSLKFLALPTCPVWIATARIASNGLRTSQGELSRSKLKFTRTCALACVSCADGYVFLFMFACMPTCLHVHTCLHAYMHTCIHVCIHAHTHIDIPYLSYICTGVDLAPVHRGRVHVRDLPDPARRRVLRRERAHGHGEPQRRHRRRQRGRGQLLRLTAPVHVRALSVHHGRRRLGRGDGSPGHAGPLINIYIYIHIYICVYIYIYIYIYIYRSTGAWRTSSPCSSPSGCSRL